jgi:predicted AAA+ superfamily ATPase
MRRRAEQHLETWIQSRRRKPLVIRGARQVGKSTLVRNFASQQGLDLVEVNLERHLGLERAFATLDTGVIRDELEALTGRSLTAPNALLFLDEIQAVPVAVQALRYFYEDLPALPVVAAGSLLEFVLADHSYPMPVGRIEYLHLGPMTFREFLGALEPDLGRYLDKLSFEAPLPEAAHRKLLDRQRKYLFVGGMPEAVLEYRESSSLQAAGAVHRRIVSTYEDDFSKYARRDRLALMQRVFRLIPRYVGRKVKYVHYSREDRSRDVKAAIELFANARVCHRVHAGSCSGIPVDADIHEFVYKLLFLDVGLMNHLCGLRWPDLQSQSPIQLVNEGAVAEQFVGQHLLFNRHGLDRPSLVYWLREGRKTNAEVDFVISLGPEVLPIEVKAGKSGSLRSLHQFVGHGKSNRALRFDLNPASRQTVSFQAPIGGAFEKRRFELMSLPLYAVEEIDRLCSPIVVDLGLGRSSVDGDVRTP